MIILCDSCMQHLSHIRWTPQCGTHFHVRGMLLATVTHNTTSYIPKLAVELQTHFKWKPQNPVISTLNGRYVYMHNNMFWEIGIKCYTSLHGSLAISWDLVFQSISSFEWSKNIFCTGEEAVVYWIWSFQKTMEKSCWGG